MKDPVFRDEDMYISVVPRTDSGELWSGYSTVALWRFRGLRAGLTNHLGSPGYLTLDVEQKTVRETLAI